MTASLPVIVYALDMHASHEQLLRALCVSNLITIHQKTPIGRLSAFCGAVSAGCGAGAGVAWLFRGHIRGRFRNDNKHPRHDIRHGLRRS